MNGYKIFVRKYRLVVVERHLDEVFTFKRYKYYFRIVIIKLIDTVARYEPVKRMCLLPF